MTEETPNPEDSARGQGEDPPPAATSRTKSRRTSLTPEQRRFLNTPRAPNEKEIAPGEESEAQPAPEPAVVPPALRRESLPPSHSEKPRPENARGKLERGNPTPVLQTDKAARSIELQHAMLILGALLLLGLAFFFGTKFSYLKYLITSRMSAGAEADGPDRFPDVAPEDLVQQALMAERAGKWDDAVERFMAAKKKDLHYRGIFFRVGKILYDHRNFDAADKAFERAIAFGENVEAADFYRGLIAVRTRDLPAAERFFEAAATAAPFVSDYHYYLGETLRLDLKPKQSLAPYAEATLLARDGQDEKVCQFKIRMGKIEAAEGAEVTAELGLQQAAGPLSVDWLMTAAALQLRAGEVEEARDLIVKARAGTAEGLFASCVNDLYFKDAAKRYPELADALHLELDLQVPFPE